MLQKKHPEEGRVDFHDHSPKNSNDHENSNYLPTIVPDFLGTSKCIF